MVRVEVKVDYTYKTNRKEYSHELSVYVQQVSPASVEQEVSAFYDELAQRNPLEGLRVILNIEILTETKI